MFELFDRRDIKTRLAKKDINQYTNINELKSAVQSLVQKRENMTPFDYILEAVDRFVQKGEAEWLYQGPNYSIYHPKTYYSSKVLLEPYGGDKAVDVCTVTGKDNFNDGYSPNGYLIYTLTPDNFYVAYINQNKIMNSEFADKVNNHDYTLEYQLQHFPELNSIIKSKVTKNTTFTVRLLFEPDPKKQHQMGLDAIKHGAWLSDIPKKLWDYEMCLTAVTSHGSDLEDVPKELRDYNMCMAAVKGYGLALKYVPKELRDYEMCIAAITADGDAMYYVPESPDYKKICMTAVTVSQGALGHIPEDLLDYDIFMAAVTASGASLLAIPKKYRDYKLCMAAVRSDGANLVYVPKELRDYDLYKTALKSRPDMIDYVPDELRDRLQQQLDGRT